MSRYSPWKITDFSGGQVEKFNDNMLPENAAFYCRNFIASREGGISKRQGQSRLNPTLGSGKIHGLHPYYFWQSGNRGLLAMHGGRPYAWNGTNFIEIGTNYTGSTISDSLFPVFNGALFNEVEFNKNIEYTLPGNASDMTLFADTVNYIVAMNGVDRPWKWDGDKIENLKGAPAKGRYPVLHKESVFCVDAPEPSTLIWSDLFRPESWTPINYWDITKDDGDEITCLQPFLGDLIIFKGNSMHVLKGTTFQDFSLRTEETRVGCAGPLASVVHQTTVFFISSYGIYLTNGMNVQNISDQIIPDTWANVNKNYLHNSVAKVVGDHIWFAVPYGDSTVNNLVLVFDPQKGAFFPMTGIGATNYVYFNDTTTALGTRLYAGDNTDGFVNLLGEGTEDYGSPVSAVWRGKFFDMGFSEVEKKAREVYIQDSPETTETADISICLDYEKNPSTGDYVYNNLSFYRDQGLTREFKTNINTNRWVHVSPMIAHSKAGACEIRGITVPFKPKQRMATRE